MHSISEESPKTSTHSGINEIVAWKWINFMGFILRLRTPFNVCFMVTLGCYIEIDQIITT